MKHPKQDANRRDFLKTASAAAAAVAAPYVITSSALGAGDRPPASDRIVMAGIGIGNMGNGDQGVVTWGTKKCSTWPSAMCSKSKQEEAKHRVNGHYKNSDCKVYGDFREVLARPTSTRSTIATPDHWHAIIVIEACRQWQRRLLPEARNADDPRRPADGRSGAALRSRSLRRQPARDGRLCVV